MCKGILRIQLDYDARGTYQDLLKTVVGEVELIGFIKGLFSKFFAGFLGKSITIFGISLGTDRFLEGFFGYYLSFKVSDFNVVSSCSVSEAHVYEYTCNGEWWDCRRVEKYPIYKYNQESGKLEYEKHFDDKAYHYTCLEKIGKEVDTPREVFYQGKCINIFLGDTSPTPIIGVGSFKKPKGFCWTPDPYKEGSTTDTILGIIAIPNMNSFTRAITGVFGLTPIKESTAYISDKNIVVLFPTGPSFMKGQKFFEALEGRWWWGWP
jgi:hypothetical protein